MQSQKTGLYYTAPDTSTMESGPEVFGNSAKIWTVYNGEAAKEDQALAQNCKGDMDSILIFAGLFSASLTGFLVVSYQDLKPDNAKLTVLLLSRITRQLEGAGHKLPPIPTSSDFVPSRASVICNLLWFMSLGACLACALAAILVQGWARNYIQITGHHSLPAHRARVRAYLYEGLRRFQMQIIVDTIPMLLHASLFLFFAGLVLFLVPVNHLIGYLSLVLFIVSIFLYAGFTFLPLIYGDCPYRTPASGLCWYGIKFFRQNGYYLPWGGYVGHFVFSTSTVEEAAHLLATSKSTARDTRDHDAMQSAVHHMDMHGTLIKFVSEHCRKDASSTDKNHIALLLDSTDLPSRITRFIEESKQMLPNDMVDRLLDCHKIVNKLERLWKKYTACQINRRRYLFGESHWGVIFEAVTAFPVDKELKHVRILPGPKEVKAAYERHAFEMVWGKFRTYYKDALRIHEWLSDIVKTPASGDEQSVVGTVSAAEPSQFYLYKEASVLVTVLSDELDTAISASEAGELHAMKQRLPFDLYIMDAWATYQKLLGRAADIFGEGDLPHVTPAFTESVDRTVVSYEELLVSLHYIQLLMLFHSTCGRFKNDTDKDSHTQSRAQDDDDDFVVTYKSCTINIEDSAKEVGKFMLGTQGQHQLMEYVLLLCEHRLQWPGYGCSTTKTDKGQTSDASHLRVHFEDPDRNMLLHMITEESCIEQLLQQLKELLGKDQDRGALDQYSSGWDKHMVTLRKYARAKVIYIANQLSRKIGLSEPAGEEWATYEEEYRAFAYPTSEIDDRDNPFE